MGAQSNNFLSLLYCFNANGIYTSFPFFADTGIGTIIQARSLNVPDKNGTLIPALVVTCQNPKGIGTSEYWLTPNTLEEQDTLVQLQAALQAVNAGNSFTLYTGLQAIGAFDSISDAGDMILINDACTIDRIFNGSNATTIYVDIQTNLVYEEVVVAGDQTTAGSYYYTYYL